ncbi:MAG: hypothetical protein O9335_11905 [Inhella sp.]|jgi:hypothetical protein|uniref:hypothetical protein n=1 Tax=Inhella sp. TaxID=1921806 RepID=UPI0022C35A51|nr:hypothetical protein [Inhella sp.]MCZ8235849.1 hypothetical protein [Inhella sp.]
MKTVETHTHSFPEATWPFHAPQNALAISTNPVMRDGFPILLVSHDSDGIWQVLCNTTTKEADCIVVCLGCCFERDQSIGELSDLPPGWMAEREKPGEQWSRRPAAQEDEHEV